VSQSRRVGNLIQDYAIGMNHPTLTSIELFSGAGGLALGIKQAGFRHRLLLESNPNAVATLRANRRMYGRDCEIHQGTIHGFDFTRFRGIDLLAAGAPCQPFSLAGKHRAHRDERNLFPEVFRAIREALPKAILIENVKGLLRPSLSDFVRYLLLQLRFPLILPDDPLDPEVWRSHLPALERAADRPRKSEALEYEVQDPLLVDAADFGVPQRRERVFFVAFRADLDVAWKPLEPTHCLAALRYAQEVDASYWKAFGIRRAPAPGHPRAREWLSASGQRHPWVTVRRALDGLPRPIPGKEAMGRHNHIGQPGARSYPGHTGSRLDLPSKTIKAGVHGVPGGENMLRQPNGKVRYFTVREAARLQTFPDTYVFEGAWGPAMRQIGNAVPVDLAKVMGKAVRDALLGAMRTGGTRRHRIDSCGFRGPSSLELVRGLKAVG
jgi:DNA (cytosine-5)-methyltransferase 1